MKNNVNHIPPPDNFGRIIEEAAEALSDPAQKLLLLQRGIKAYHDIAGVYKLCTPLVEAALRKYMLDEALRICPGNRKTIAIMMQSGKINKPNIMLSRLYQFRHFVMVCLVMVFFSVVYPTWGFLNDGTGLPGGEIAYKGEPIKGIRIDDSPKSLAAVGLNPPQNDMNPFTGKHIGEEKSSQIKTPATFHGKIRNITENAPEQTTEDNSIALSLYKPGAEVKGLERVETKRKHPDLKKKKDMHIFTRSALTKQFALGVNRIVVDPGHGGKDIGASGVCGDMDEKDVTLALSFQLAEKLEKELKCEVILTRRTDTYLTLDERTGLANDVNADLFVSIHTNASYQSASFGIETYYLNLATDDEAILLAARENAEHAKTIRDLYWLLNDLMQNAKISESKRLAEHVQHFMINGLRNKYELIRDKGVRQAPFYVLLEAVMPAILVETAFISNPRECKRLIDPDYQNYLTDAITKGIVSFINEIHPTDALAINGTSAP